MKKYDLAALDAEEQIIKEALAGSPPPAGFLLPKEFSKAQADQILEGIEKLRRVIFEALSVQQLTGFISLGRINEIVDAAMSLSGDSTEAHMIYILRDTYLFGADQKANLAKSRKAASDNRRATARKKHVRWTEEAVRIWKSKPSLSVSACAASIRTQLRLGEEVKTIADVIRTLRPNLNAGRSRKKDGDDC